MTTAPGLWLDAIVAGTGLGESVSVGHLAIAHTIGSDGG